MPGFPSVLLFYVFSFVLPIETSRSPDPARTIVFSYRMRRVYSWIWHSWTFGVLLFI